LGISLITSHHVLSKVNTDGESAKELWDGPKAAFKNKSVLNQLNILIRLINFQMQEESNLNLYYVTLDSILYPNYN